MAILRPCRGKTPKIGKNVFLAENCVIIGDVEIGDESSIWYNVVLRGDVMPIRIGRQTNVQDGTVVHGTYGEYGTTLGDRVTIGHSVVLHGCEVKDAALVGMGAILMDACVVGEHSLIGAGALLTERSIIPPESLVVGRPAKVRRALTSEEVKSLEDSADHYLLYKTWYS